MTSQSSDSSSEPSSQQDTSSNPGVDSTTRWEIEVDAAQVTESLLDGYPLSLTFDHRSMVAQGAAPDGADLVLISHRGDVVTSLPRVLDVRSGWNRVDTTIWFVIDERIAAGSRIGDTYYLVVQDPELVPVENRARIFLDFEDFGSDPLSSTKWSQVQSSEGERSVTQTSTALVLSAQRPELYPESYITVRQAGRSYWSSVRVDVMTRFINSGMSGTCGRIFPVSLTSVGDNALRAGLQSDISAYQSLSYLDMIGNHEIEPIDNPAPSQGSWEIHSLAWIGSDISYWRDNIPIWTTQGKGNVTRPNQTNLQLEFSVGVHSQGCNEAGELGLEIDWYRTRRFTYPEPTARLKP